MPISQTPPSNPSRVPVRKRAYELDGTGNLKTKRWNISEGVGSAFNWYHIEFPRERQEDPIEAAELASHLCPPLTRQEILMLVNDVSFCSNINGTLIFGINLTGQGSSDFPLRIATRVTDNCIITVSWGRVPGLEFKSLSTEGLLPAIPVLKEADAGHNEETGDDEEAGDNEEAGDDEDSVVNILAAWNSMNDAEEPEQPAPDRISGLLVHVVYAHVDHIQLAMNELEIELPSLELLLNSGDSKLKNEILDGRKCSMMLINLQRLIQVVEYGDQVFSDVRENCATKIWFTNEDAVVFGELIGRLRRLKERLGCLISRATAVQAGLNSWLAMQIKRKLYCILSCSMISQLLFIVTGIFRMNVGGLPWTGKSDKYGFRSVMLLCAAILSIPLICFGILFAWKRRRALTRR